MVPVIFRAFAFPTKSPFFSMTKEAASPVSEILGNEPHFHPFDFLMTTDFSIIWTMFLVLTRNVSLAAGFELWLKSLCRSLSSSLRPEFAEMATSVEGIGFLVGWFFFSAFSSASSLLGVAVRRAQVKTTEKYCSFML